ncbi:sugar phosphate isomerase/epimerase family protein [Oceaniglobus trochenteri]|uniref:sugar phosphate isomerase/epimerase family protein n=1 Tax=Oceaniglobus trochenteri TaxID=2763260 RepID=UPI001CFFD26D|nr:sugar phosphate isomerase/epimerase [Oceaniglobus trochenteri]
MTGPDLSIQLYSLRNAGPLDRQLDIAAEAGFAHVEPVGSHLMAPDALARALGDRGLSAPTTHVSAPDLFGRPDEVIAAARAAGIGRVFLAAPVREDWTGRHAFWTEFAGRVARLADRFAAADLRLGYHNHHFEYLECEDGRTGLEILLEETAQSGLAWQADLAWIVRARQSPLDLIARYGDRISAVHVKDTAQKGDLLAEDGWTVPGKGQMDWTALAAALAGTRADVMVAEHDNPADPAALARSAHAALQATFGEAA